MRHSTMFERRIPIRRALVFWRLVGGVVSGFGVGLGFGPEEWWLPQAVWWPIRVVVVTWVVSGAAYYTIEKLVVLLRKEPGLVITPAFVTIATTLHVRTLEWSSIRDLRVLRFRRGVVRFHTRSGRRVSVDCGELDGGVDPYVLASEIVEYSRELMVAPARRGS